MTFRKYLRLCAVSFVPLLLIGFVIFRFVVPYPSAVITCEAVTETFENCRHLGDIDSDNSLRVAVRARAPSMVDLRFDGAESGRDHFIAIEATGRIFHTTRILSVSEFVGRNNEFPPFMRAPFDQVVALNFGPEDWSTGRPGMPYCNDLNLKAQQGVFSASCYGESWGGIVTFEGLGRDKERLETLRLAASEEVKRLDRDHLLYQVVTYPLFIWIFLAISAAIWVVVQAIRFVRRG